MQNEAVKSSVRDVPGPVIAGLISESTLETLRYAADQADVRLLGIRAHRLLDATPIFTVVYCCRNPAHACLFTGNGIYSRMIEETFLNTSEIAAEFSFCHHQI